MWLSCQSISSLIENTKSIDCTNSSREIVKLALLFSGLDIGCQGIVLIDHRDLKLGDETLSVSACSYMPIYRCQSESCKRQSYLGVY